MQCVPDLRSSIDEALLRAITANSTQNEAINNCTFLDLTVKHDGASTSKGNSATPTSLADVVAMEGNVQHPTSPRPQYNAPVCLVSHLSSSINQDLAEADQSMENDATNNENAADSPEDTPERGDLMPENGNSSNEGAVGGIESSALPDLAKVTTNPTNCEVDFVDTDL